MRVTGAVLLGFGYLGTFSVPYRTRQGFRRAVMLQQLHRPGIVRQHYKQEPQPDFNRRWHHILTPYIHSDNFVDLLYHTFCYLSSHTKKQPLYMSCFSYVFSHQLMVGSFILRRRAEAVPYLTACRFFFSMYCSIYSGDTPRVSASNPPFTLSAIAMLSCERSI